ncbi:MAG TPA: ATP-binding protein, partial [Alphaproteobacteria bacterium]|nr:ATP-binding protein [Alphaproteobacteria bacterium]
QVTIAVQRSADKVKVIVDDVGPGIPENRLERVFDRFYSERPVSESFGMHSGLGLSIAKQIIAAHQGTISAENRKDEKGHILGARFTVRLRAS